MFINHDFIYKILEETKNPSNEEIKEVLKIKDKQLDKLLKTVIIKNGEYERESLIRACCGGRLIIQEE